MKTERRNSLKLSYSTRKSIHQHPDIAYRYLPGVGLVTEEQEKTTLEENVLQLMGSRSKSGREKLKRAETSLYRSEQEKHRAKILRKQKRKKQAPTSNFDNSEKATENANNASQGNQGSSSDEVEDEEKEERAENLSSTSSDTLFSEEQSEDAEETQLQASSTKEEGEKEKTNQKNPTEPTTQSSSYQVSTSSSVNQRYSFRNEANEARQVFEIGEEVLCKYRILNRFYKARIIQRDLIRQIYKVQYLDIDEMDDAVKPIRLRKVAHENSV
jgi:cobalamin biosynthesis protein CobT